MPTNLRSIGLGPRPGVDPRTVLRRANAMLLELGCQDAELSVVLCDDELIRKQNAAYRNKDRATDVLSFPLHEPSSPGVELPAPDPDEPPLLLGDIFISIPTARSQAARHGIDLRDEVTRLLAHGLLHLLGHVHGTKAQGARMDREMNRLIRAASPHRRRSGD